MSPRTLFPEYAVAAGSVQIDSSGSGGLFRLSVSRTINRGADEARLELGRAVDLDVQEGEALEVELGYEGELTRVFTGTVTGVTHGPSRFSVQALGGQDLLMRTRVDRSFQAQSAGEIFQALAGEAGAVVSRAEDGVTLSFYLADSSVNCFEHALRLGFHGGCDLYCDADGGLVFAPLPAPAQPRTLSFGAELIRASLHRTSPVSMPQYLPESPASSGGEDTWLAKDNSGALAEAGEGAPRLGYSPLMRTQEHAQAAADTHWERLLRDSSRGGVELVGLPGLQLGDAVQIEDLPGGEGGLYQVLAVEHRFDFRRGFRTRARLAAAQEGL